MEIILALLLFVVGMCLYEYREYLELKKQVEAMKQEAFNKYSSRKGF